MHPSRYVFLLNDSARAIECEYQEDGSTSVLKTLDQTIQEGDMVLVETGTRFKLTVSKVKAVDVDVDLEANNKMNWIHQKLDMEPIEKRLAQEAEAIAAVKKAETKRKRDELKKALVANHEDEIAGLAIANSSSDDGPVIEPPASAG